MQNLHILPISKDLQGLDRTNQQYIILLKHDLFSGPLHRLDTKQSHKLSLAQNKRQNGRLERNSRQ